MLFTGLHCQQVYSDDTTSLGAITENRSSRPGDLRTFQDERALAPDERLGRLDEMSHEPGQRQLGANLVVGDVDDAGDRLALCSTMTSSLMAACPEAARPISELSRDARHTIKLAQAAQT